MKKALGIDIGGTKIAAGMINEAGLIEKEVTVASQPKNAEAMFQALCTAIDTVLASSNVQPAHVGLGVPGLVDRRNGIAVFQNNLPWHHFPLRQELQRRYPQFASITLDNDVYQAAFAEWHLHQLSQDDTLVFLTVSTGVSCAVMTNEHFLRGQGFAGEVGLLPTTIKNQRLEHVVSGPGLAEQGKHAYNDGTVEAAEIFLRYASGEPIAQRLISDWVKHLSQGIYTLCCVLDPSKLILGGSVLLKNPMMLEIIRNEVRQLALDVQQSQAQRIVLSSLGNKGGMIGAGLASLSAFAAESANLT